MNHRKWNFDIDRLLNPLVPPPPWHLLPNAISRWLGHRPSPPPPTGNLMPIFYSFLGVFLSIALIESVSPRIPSFPDHHAPLIVGSLGAAAVLEFYAIEAPLAQPRNAIGGQLVSAITGVAVAKLFLLVGSDARFEEIKWLGGAIACASATALMALTKTVHPPAGATALLAVVDPNLIRTGWFLIPVLLLSCTLMLVVALIVNNIERRFPVYWWTPENLRARPIFRRRSVESMEKKGADKNAVESTPPQQLAIKDGGCVDPEAQDATEEEEDTRHVGDIVIRPGQVVVPEHLFLTQEETQLLETISRRL